MRTTFLLVLVIVAATLVLVQLIFGAVVDLVVGIMLVGLVIAAFALGRSLTSKS
ncbi:hypothetical protein [Rhizobium sp. 18065]|uniref:hypothetical protein n=1 Tax=Rhizobium sp. 18065 TaxID=2681411 RepID=UPI001356D1EF|nr:hypothetical protein [Rhizobium sp. 18065]